MWGWKDQRARIFLGFSRALHEHAMKSGGHDMMMMMMICLVIDSHGSYSDREIDCEQSPIFRIFLCWSSLAPQLLALKLRFFFIRNICARNIFWLQRFLTNILVKKCTNKFDCLVYKMFFSNELRPSLNVQSDSIRGTPRQLSENICSEDDFRSRIFGAFVVKFLGRLPLLGFSNIWKMV